MYKNFCLKVISLAACGLFLAALLNYSVDPYDVWGHAKVEGLNMANPKVMDIERWATPMRFTLLQEQPEVVFLGNSQVRWGLDPACYEAESGRKAYNFGIPGVTRYEQTAYAKHILAVDKNLKELVLCLDFTMYVEGAHFKEEKFLAGFNEGQISVDRPTMDNLATTLLSWEAVKDSLKTIQLNRANRWQEPFDSPEGSLSDEAIITHFQRDFRAFDNPVNRMQREGKTTEGRLDESSMARLQEIADMCRDKGVKLTLVVLPTHVKQLANYDGCWDVYEEWLRRSVQIAPVWYFADYNKITTSEVRPGPVSAETNEFFWDTVHPKHMLGDIVQRVILGKEQAWQNSGLLLQPDNIDGYLAKLLADKEAWESAHPVDVEASNFSMGFVDSMPPSLQGKKLQPAAECAALDLPGSSSLMVKQSKYLDLWGKMLTDLDYQTRIFAVLESSAGKKFYAQAEYPVLKLVMNPAAVEKVQGFHLQMPLWGVPADDYKLSFILLSGDGRAYLSEVQADISVE